MATVALAGCQTDQQKNAAVKQFPAAAREGCAEAVAEWTPEVKKSRAKYFGVSIANLPGYFCPRLVKAMAAGRITNDLALSQKLKIIKES